MPYLTAHQGAPGEARAATPGRKRRLERPPTSRGRVLGCAWRWRSAPARWSASSLERLLVGVGAGALHALPGQLAGRHRAGRRRRSTTWSSRRWRRSRADLKVRYQEAVADALRDPLTGLGNHRAFQEELDRQVESAQRYGVPVSLVLIDLDEFKQINDSEGHAFGDQALAHFGGLVKRGLRKVDRSFRIGGDEFAILLPQTDAEAAKIVSRRLLATRAAARRARATSIRAACPSRPASPRCPSPPPDAPSCTARPIPRCMRPSGPAAPRWSSSTARSTPTADPSGLGAAVAEVIGPRLAAAGLPADHGAGKPAALLGVRGADPARSRRRRSPIRPACSRRRPAAGTCCRWSWPASRRSWPAPPAGARAVPVGQPVAAPRSRRPSSAPPRC